MANVTLEKSGSRLYFAGNTFPLKDAIKKIGGHWDGDRKQWWIGTAKQSDAEALVANAEANPGKGAPSDDARVYAKVEYKDRNYYVIAEGQGRCRLTVLDGSLDFWADMAACKLVKTYQPRERTFRGRTTTSYTTLGSIRRFVADQKELESKGYEACCACGKRSRELVHDLEDGLMKCYACCDMPAN